MKKTGKALLAGILAIAFCLAALQNVVLASHPFTNIAAIQYVNDGVLAAQYRNGGLEVERIEAGGVVTARFTVPGTQNGQLVSLSDLDADEAGNVYLLLDLSDPLTGRRTGQRLAVYQPDRFLFQRTASHVLPAGQQNVRWQWLTVTSSVSVMGTVPGEISLVREVYDAQNLTQSVLTPRSSRTYSLAANEGIWQAWAMGSDIAYISESGKLFVASESTAPVEVYPARALDRVMYPLYAAPIDTGSMYLGEQESGDLLSIDLATRETTVLKSGTEPFAGSAGYGPIDLLQASVVSERDFAGVVKDAAADRYNLILSVDGQAQVIRQARPGTVQMLAGTALWTVLWLLTLAAVLGLMTALSRLFRSRRRLASRLLTAAVPLLVLAVVLFGGFSYFSYEASIRQSFEKQVVDEGNMLMALFGTESFDAIEYPYDRTGDDYGYLMDQMNTRAVYTRTAYYERGQLYTGVDRDAPCFYPFGMHMNAEAEALYRRAAYTGTAQTGVLRDKNGQRLVCVTPVGGAAGDTIYLLETGILTGNIQAYTRGFLWNFCLVGAAFLAAVSAILFMAFRRVLRPVSRLRQGLEQFAQGDRTVRLEDVGSEEFSAIARVFNQMAGDIDVQLHNLRQTSAAYYRFIPQKVFRLLGKDNLGDLDLDSGRLEDHPILLVELHMPSRLDHTAAKARTDRFFAVVDELCEQNGAVLFTDSADLRRLRVVCPDGADTAVDIALAALARLDGLNAAAPVQDRLDAFFLVHQAPVYYGICGDEQRLVPAMIGGELDLLNAQAEELRRTASRLVVTQAALAHMDADHYYHRAIGCLEGADEDRFGLYDFYDSRPPEEIRLINETRPTFDKAMALYRQGRWYDAKNMFTLVLRENQFDNVSRAYIFRCEKRLAHKS